MEALLKEFQHLKVQLEEIKSATDSFSSRNVIGSGGFGKVYKGEIFHSKGRGTVAIKRLDHRHGQGNAEFWKEIMMLSRYTHENLVSLVGFCDEGGEKILIYELESNGSLDRHLSVTSLTWIQRLRICLDAARGLSYLHDDKGTQQRVLHRDIKSSNILLDTNLKAKISDLGLSKIGPANQQHTVVVSNVVGTFGYLDPLYIDMGILTKESDVYSFGVVLFEVLCGRLCFDNSNGPLKILVRKWKQSYKEKKLDEIIFQGMVQQMDLNSLESFSDIAFRCLKKRREDRPTMSQVVKKLEIALEDQELFERVNLPKNYKEMIKTAVPPLNYRSEGDLKKLFFKGVLLNAGKTWFSLNMIGEHCEMISMAECLIPVPSDSDYYRYSSEYNSRFAVGCYEPSKLIFETLVRYQFLSPQVTYTVNLVFKHKYSKDRYIGLKYKVKGEKKSYTFLSDERENGWLAVELCQFTSDHRMADLEIMFDIRHCQNILIDGIEFKPVEKVDHGLLKNDQGDIQPKSDSDTYWEHKLPNDYENILKWSKDAVHWKTKKELYYALCQGILINDGEEWFFLAKDGKKCLMLPARAALEEDRWEWKSLPETRFEVAYHSSREFGIFCKFKAKLLSTQTTYATYLVYKLREDYYNVQPPPVQVKDKNSDSREICHVYLSTPQTPVISQNSDDIKTHNPMNRPKIKGLPRRRCDGWMEVQVSEFQTLDTTRMISTRLQLSSYDMSLDVISV